MRDDVNVANAFCLAQSRNPTHIARPRYNGLMALWDRKWLHAQLNLAWHLLRHFAAKLWPWRRRFKLKRFQDNYVHEGLPPATETYRDNAHHFGRCTGCGACDQACPLLGVLSPSNFIGPMSFVLSGARSAPDLNSIAQTLHLMVGPKCQECQRCDSVCPEQIPLLRLADLLLKQLDSVELAREKRSARVAPSPRT